MRFFVYSKALATEGWRSFTRMPALPWLVAAGILMASAALYLRLPLREPGRSSLQSIALCDQLVCMLLAGAYTLSWRGSRQGASWPVSSIAQTTLRGLGAIASLCVTLGLLVGCQYLLAALKGDLEARVPLVSDPIRLEPHYLLLWCSLSVYGAVLIAWAQALRTALSRSVALMALLLLVFTGWLLPFLIDDQPALQFFLGWLPNLAALSPMVDPELGDELPLRLILYSGLHILMVWSFASLIRDLRRSAPSGVESTASEA